jgi:hypothetical protein
MFLLVYCILHYLFQTDSISHEFFFDLLTSFATYNIVRSFHLLLRPLLRFILNSSEQSKGYNTY